MILSLLMITLPKIKTIIQPANSQMTIEERIAGFATLGQQLRELPATTKDDLFARAGNRNPWFTPDNITLALTGIGQFLDHDTLTNWLNRYSLTNEAKNIGLVMAGNIPLVGFHDFMSVLLAGHRAHIKLSSQDNVLPTAVIDLLLTINPAFAGQIHIVDLLPKLEAVIATGSDNSARYFKKYFRDIPHIIRQNRTSAAVIDGTETAAELQLLGNDIFSFFGLGCRNVAKIFIPKGYDINLIAEALQGFAEVGNHAKYFNNYEYNKAIYLVNKVPHYDTGFVLFKEDQALASPLAVVYYEEYDTIDGLHDTLQLHRDKLQCIVSKTEPGQPTVAFGQAQLPAIDDYADGVDTMAFLTQL